MLKNDIARYTHAGNLHRFIIPGEPVVKKNNRPIYKAGNRPFLGKSAKLVSAETAITLMLKSVYKGKVLAGELAITFIAYLGTNRRKDLSNCFEIYADALQRAGVIADDNNITMLIMHKRYDKDNPRAEIDIVEVK